MTTTHNGALYGVERGLLESLAHYVDGVPLVGGRGTPLQSLLDDSYRREADGLLADLDAITGLMHDHDRRVLANRLAGLSQLLQDNRPRPEAAGPDPADTQPFTADYSNGGKPLTDEEDDKVPAAPVLEAEAEAQPDAADDGDGPDGSKGRR